jgi:nucleotide-binding universal stress UspA family protein
MGICGKRRWWKKAGSITRAAVGSPHVPNHYRSHTMIRTLLPIDGSPEALDAVRQALHLRAQGLDFTAVLLNVQDPPHLYEVVLAPDADVIEGASHEAGEHALLEARALLDAAGVAHESLVVSGDAAQQVVEQAELQGCDLIVMTGHRHSVTQVVERHSRIPVLLVPHLRPEVEAEDLAELAALSEAADQVSARA